MDEPGGGAESSLTQAGEEAGKERNLWEGGEGAVFFGGNEVPESNTFWKERAYIFIYINL